MSFTYFTLQAYGRGDRLDPLCDNDCITSHFVVLDHPLHGSYSHSTFSGVWDMEISVKSPGRYAIRLEVDGVTSPIIFFRAHSKAAGGGLHPIRQPKTRLEGNASNPGDIFDVQPGKMSEQDTTECKTALHLLARTCIKLADPMTLMLLIFKCVFGMMLVSLIHSVIRVR